MRQNAPKNSLIFILSDLFWAIDLSRFHFNYPLLAQKRDSEKTEQVPTELANVNISAKTRYWEKHSKCPPLNFIANVDILPKYQLNCLKKNGSQQSQGTVLVRPKIGVWKPSLEEPKDSLSFLKVSKLEEEGVLMQHPDTFNKLPVFFTTSSPANRGVSSQTSISQKISPSFPYS